MKICVLGSGSSGNSIYVESGGFQFLVDAGLSRRELRLRLDSIGSRLEDIRAVLVSHEHTDHISGLRTLCAAHRIPVYANRHTASAMMERGIALPEMLFFRTGAPFVLGPVVVTPFSLPHDACEPAGFIIHDGGCRLGIATDLGSPSESVRGFLRGCRALVVESNHDEELLSNGSRPLSLKERIRSEHGHLSNEMAAALIADVATEDLADVFLAHLSVECNRPEFARSAASRALDDRGLSGVAVRLTYPDRISDIVEYA